VATLADGGVACEEMATGDFSSLTFGLPPAKRGPFDPPPPPPPPPGTGDNIKFLLGKTWRLAKTAPGFEKELIDACTELGVAAGLSERELRGEPDLGHGAERACNLAASKIAEIFRKAKESRIVLDLSIEPTHCFVDVDATRACLAQCGTPPQGDIRTHCIGGELDGTCSGRCSGSCALLPGAGTGTCHGACSGKCDREFRGTCGGKCSGTCDGAPSRGKRCEGICDGACSGDAQGACGGRCDGSCSGSWDPPAPSSKCAGLCVGACSGGDVKQPACSGEYAPRGIEPVCQAACGAEAAMGLRCDIPLVRVAIRGGKPTRELQRALAGVQSAVPKIVRLQQGAAKRLPHAIESAITAGVDWSNAFATAGPHPLLCIRSNVDALHEAAKWLELATHATDAIGPAIKTDPPPQGKPEEE
jgi:hypothetical protein